MYHDVQSYWLVQSGWPRLLLWCARRCEENYRREDRMPVNLGAIMTQPLEVVSCVTDARWEPSAATTS